MGRKFDMKSCFEMIFHATAPRVMRGEVVRHGSAERVSRNAFPQNKLLPVPGGSRNAFRTSMHAAPGNSRNAFLLVLSAPGGSRNAFLLALPCYPCQEVRATRSSSHFHARLCTWRFAKCFPFRACTQWCKKCVHGPSRKHRASVSFWLSSEPLAVYNLVNMRSTSTAP